MLFLMKNIFVFLLGVGIVFIVYAVITGSSSPAHKDEVQFAGQTNDTTPQQGGLIITPIEHASMILELAGAVVFVDPVGDLARYEALGKDPDIILVTDIHGDHLDTEILGALATSDVALIIPEAVLAELPQIEADVIVLENGDQVELQGLIVEAVPMYNVPETTDSRHPKGRGNGYIIDGGMGRIYIAGDTGPTEEMRALTNIDSAFVPMNIPYTMTVEEAAEAVLAFKPRSVYPYHYRGEEGYADIEEFKRLVDEGNAGVNVVLLDWYQGAAPNEVQSEIE